MKKILIIEDDPIVARIYQNRLQKEACEVEIATDGQSGFYRIHEFQPDAVLLDLMLPKMNGVDILKKIRAQAQFQRVRITNKHLLPVYNKPMIYYPIETLVNAGINDILIVTGGQNAGDFLRLLRNGREFGLKHIDYSYQEGEGGIADALRLAEHFADGDKICVILGDNLIEGNIIDAVQSFSAQQRGARILLKPVPDAQRFGVAEINGDRIAGIEEKPPNPKSNLAVTGIYLYDATVFQKVETLQPSGRGELEITDVNNLYIEEGTMTFSTLDGWWTDAGTIESLLRASKLVAETGANNVPFPRNSG
jgi:glucose-1-phosphate thymidylyltransferase